MCSRKCAATALHSVIMIFWNKYHEQALKQKCCFPDVLFNRGNGNVIIILLLFLQQHPTANYV